MKILLFLSISETELVISNSDNLHSFMLIGKGSVSGIDQKLM